jgi:DNA topoisomerase IA
MATQESGTVAVLAEKPSVARDIASVLGATRKRDGYLHGNGYVVTWAIGHLAALAQPHEIDPAWRQWRRDLLPMLPELAIRDFSPVAPLVKSTFAPAMIFPEGSVTFPVSSPV